MSQATLSDAEIFAQAVAPPGSTMNRESAEAILRWQFPRAVHDRISELLDKSREETITPDEYQVLDRYRRVGNMINILQAQARHVLSQSS